MANHAQRRQRHTAREHALAGLASPPPAPADLAQVLIPWDAAVALHAGAVEVLVDAGRDDLVGTGAVAALSGAMGDVTTAGQVPLTVAEAAALGRFCTAYADEDPRLAHLAPRLDLDRGAAAT